MSVFRGPIGEADLSKIQLRVHHDEDAEIYINGTLVGRFSGYSINYLESEIDEKARAALKKGKNTIAVHCKQTGGGQYIDVGLIEVVEVERGK